MNKKIYFNNKFLEFFDTGMQLASNEQIKIYNTLTENSLFEIEQLFLNEAHTTIIKINYFYFSTVLNYFKNKFKYIEAAGGLIKKQNNYLFIYRLNKWDLPKGKLDKGETIEHAAIRECEEECGVKDLTITRQLPSTFHIYFYKNNWAIKQTFWFCMDTNYNETLIPQTEENITDVKWFTKNDIDTFVLKNTYLTITDVLTEGLV